jgi:thymidylate kinase
MKIVAIEGLRGCGKSTLINQFKEKYNPLKLLTYKFPTKETIEILSKHKYDMEKLSDVLEYNLQFVYDFIHFYRTLGKPPSHCINDTFLIDRYILSNLAHFKYDMYQINGGAAQWEGISNLLYTMYNDFYVEKPDLIIYLKTNKYMQSDTKFDSGKYEGAEHELEWFYNTELSNLKNKLNIPFMTFEAFQPETFPNVESILKDKGYLE